jgi:hypothetical protein
MNGAGAQINAAQARWIRSQASRNTSVEVA